MLNNTERMIQNLRRQANLDFETMWEIFKTQTPGPSHSSASPVEEMSQNIKNEHFIPLPR
jgi:hypothetical protein